MVLSSVHIGDVLSKSHNWVAPQPDKTYKQITARLWGKGLTLRDEVPGSQIAASRQLQVKAGQFLISRIDARHGAFGIVPPDLDGALVSNDFPCFNVNTGLVLADYLQWYARTEHFIRLCRRASEGSTNRVRLKETSLLEKVISVPNIGEQQRIVRDLNQVETLIERKRKITKVVQNNIQVLLSNAFQKTVKSAPCHPMSEVAPLVRRPVIVDPNRSYRELGVRSFGRGTFRKPSLIGSELTWQKPFLIQSGDIVFSNIKAWEGAFAVATSGDHNHVGSHRYLTCVPVVGVATANFVWFYLQSREGMAKISAASPGSADRNRTLNQKKLAGLTVPVPPIEKQFWFDRLLCRTRKIGALGTSIMTDMNDMSSVNPGLIPVSFHVVDA